MKAAWIMFDIYDHIYKINMNLKWFVNSWNCYFIIYIYIPSGHYYIHSIWKKSYGVNQWLTSFFK